MRRFGIPEVAFIDLDDLSVQHTRFKSKAG